MAESFSIVNSLIVRRNDSDSSFSPVSAEEYWQLRLDDDTSQEGLRLSGFGSLKLHVKKIENTPVLCVDVSSSIHDFCLPISVEDLIDHVVVANQWIPLREEECENIQFLLADHGLVQGMPLDVATYSKVLALSNAISKPASIDDEVSESLVQSKAITEDFQLKFAPFPYQRDGINWLCGQYLSGIGGVLADEMGLGKTAQLIGLIDFILTTEKESSRVLIVVPSSLKMNWCKELINFSHYANEVIVHAGPNRGTRLRDIKNHKVVLTTYETLVRDDFLFKQITYSAVVCDEAHWLKNVNALKRVALAELKSSCKFLASGTPIHNKLLDLWSLIDIVQPYALGNVESFEDLIQDSPREAEKLGELVSPLILRRTGMDVDLQLPEKFEKLIPLEMGEADKVEYRELCSGSHQETFGQRGRATFQKQRIYCAHTGIFSSPANAFQGTKTQYLRDEVFKIQMLGEKALLFISDLLAPIDLYIELFRNEYPNSFVMNIDGRTKSDDRFGIVNAFSEQEGFALLLINPTVGGEGLNITSANHVFHVNPPWNPAKVAQATFRVVRPGQRRTTFVHHLYYVDTIESKMMQLLENKQEISDIALEESEIMSAEKTSDEYLSSMKSTHITKGGI